MAARLDIPHRPAPARAKKVAGLLIAPPLAACVNLLAPCDSVYRWRGEIQHDAEHPLLIKTARDRYAELEAAIRANHPYELPEIIAVSINQGLPAYLQWIASETRTDTPA